MAAQRSGSLPLPYCTDWQRQLNAIPLDEQQPQELVSKFYVQHIVTRDDAHESSVFFNQHRWLLCNRFVTSFELASTSTIGKLASITSLTADSRRSRFLTTSESARFSRTEPHWAPFLQDRQVSET